MSVVVAGNAERKKLDSIRGRIAALEDEIADLTEARLSVEETTQRVLSAVRRRREQLRFKMNAFSSAGGGLPKLPDDWTVWLATDAEIEERIRAAVEREVTESGLPLRERRAAIAKLEAEIAELRGLEEREVLRLERAGYLVDRRPPESPADVERLLQTWEEETA